jgi:hypothetical protein
VYRTNDFVQQRHAYNMHVTRELMRTYTLFKAQFNINVMPREGHNPAPVCFLLQPKPSQLLEQERAEPDPSEK